MIVRSENCEITYHDGSNVKSAEVWRDELGRLHRVGGPAQTLWHSNGTIQSESWQYHGKRHREGPHPAITVWGENGAKLYEYWAVNDVMSSTEHPCVNHYDYNGNLISSVWYKDYKIHREDGPAIFMLSFDDFDDAKTTEVYHWYYEGERIDDGPLAKIIDFSKHTLTEEEKFILKLYYS